MENQKSKLRISGSATECLLTPSATEFAILTGFIPSDVCVACPESGVGLPCGAWGDALKDKDVIAHIPSYEGKEKIEIFKSLLVSGLIGKVKSLRFADTLDALHSFAYDPEMVRIEINYLFTSPQVQKTNNFKLKYTGSELLKAVFPEPKWAVAGILPEGLTILGGKPKAGKSILALNIAIAVATGGHVLGRTVEPGLCLYFALEDNPRRLQSRTKQMIGTDKVDLENLLTVYDLPKIGDGCIKKIISEIEHAKDVRLVIIDTLQKIRPISTNNNCYQADYEIIGKLKAISDRYGLPVVVVHHVRKMGAEDVFDTFSGTFGLTGAADSMMILGRCRAGVVLSVRGRDVEDAEFAIKFDPEFMTWQMLGNASDVQSTVNQQVVFDCIKDAEGPLKRDEIIKQTRLKSDTLNKILSKLLKSGAITKPGHGAYEINNTK